MGSGADGYLLHCARNAADGAVRSRLHLSQISIRRTELSRTGIAYEIVSKYEYIIVGNTRE